MIASKPFEVSKAQVWQAFKQVKANRGAAGVDGQTLAQFEAKLSGNLYKLWNRMTSGSYHPPAVRRVEIPKRDGGKRPLGIPTVADRIAQMVVKNQIEPLLDPLFHEDSYGYRPNRSAHDALAKARQRCWQRAWVLDVDIKGFFDTIEHGLMMKALKHHVQSPWMLLYIQRWLTAPVALSDGVQEPRTKGTPQGGVISPLLANLYLHYAFDAWMKRNHADIPFERYADDIVCHCATQEQAERLRHALEQRLAECHLQLHPVKTKVVYCKQSERRFDYPRIQFDFLGYTFRPRQVLKKTGRAGTSFCPAVSNEAAKQMRGRVRELVHRREYRDVQALAKRLNPIIRGWIAYYGKFYRSHLTNNVLARIDERLATWLCQVYKRFKRSRVKAFEWIRRTRKHRCDLFAHWSILTPRYSKT
ncbi:MAG: group II intron reverse transcriptase/maturase [Rhodoferax sp.]|nr:group II intron reverse transcriptase/maturase [Rhodoferax sp.]